MALNPIVFLPFVIAVIPFIPVIMEILRRKDKGPREISTKTIYEGKPNLRVPLLERARANARVRTIGDAVRANGDVSIPDRAEIGSSLVVQGNLLLGTRSHVRGSLKALGNVEVGESSVIEGHVVAEGKVVIRRDCIVKGIVDSHGDIVIEEGAVVEAVSTEGKVEIRLGARVKRRVLAGDFIAESEVSKENTPQGVVEHVEEKGIGETEGLPSRPTAPIGMETKGESTPLVEKADETSVILERLLAAKIRDELKMKLRK